MEYWCRNKKQHNKTYRENNLETIAIMKKEQRARKRAATIHKLSNRDIQKLLKFFKHSCAYCNERFLKNSKGKYQYHLDHVQPLSKGGNHTLYNLVPACQKCNTSKNAFDMKKWYRNKPFYSIDNELRILKWYFIHFKS